METNWNDFENFIGEEFPPCLKRILYLCGYDNFISIKEMKESHILKVERFIEENHRDEINRLSCCHSEYYQQQSIFKFLPGHETTLLVLPKYIDKYFISRQTSKTYGQNEKYSFILKEMLKTAEANSLQSDSHARYPDSIRYFFTFIFLVCGRFCYEMLKANLPIPATKTILRCIDNSKTPIIEGRLRARELSEYLDKLKCTKYVWLSEDATAIISKVTYDPSTNQLVGLVLPTNKTTGYPISMSFLADDAETIKKHLQHSKSTVLYLIMAQPLDETVPPFVLQMFGSDNRFNSQDVVQRWKHTIAELKGFGVTVAGWSSDGDPKLLSTMCHQIIHEDSELICIQDMIHIATKLRNRLLKPGIHLSMGTKFVSVAHLKTLLLNVNKSIHGLTNSDVCPLDRQNFRSFQKIIEPRVIEALKGRVDNSQGTVKYLQLCDQITSSFLHFVLKPTDRIFRMYNALYFLRIWRNHIKSSRYLTLKDNFITHNAYTCIEINALGMIALIKKFREENAPHLFLLGIFDSQTCEKTFRQLRSMGTVDFTKINFTLYDLINMIGRIEVQNDIAYFKLSQGEVSFPFLIKRAKKTITCDLPTDSEINSILQNAKVAAITEARDFGMNVSDIEEFRFQSKIAFPGNSDELFDDDEEEEIVDEIENISSNSSDNAIETEHENEQMKEKSNFTTVVDENGVERIIRKSTLVWMLTEPGAALSKDRLRRVQLGKRKQPS